MKGPSEKDRRIPRTMSTQHPDNANLPEWCTTGILEGDAEVEEAYFAYEALGCEEVMWDSEGKDTDTRVVRKLLSKYDGFFRDLVLGRDVFLTYRIPNPRVEVVERKIVVETLQSIPVSHDVASAFYGCDATPIFEVILPFTTKGEELIWLHNYYKKAIVAAEEVVLNGELKVKEWVGPVMPKAIEIIPLVEDMDSLLKVDEIVSSYAGAMGVRRIRVFLARSDPALNYGLISAVLLNKLALSRLGALPQRRDLEIEIHPILGVGSMPFRGHLSPTNLQGFLSEYSGVSTVTIQSAIKYDHPLEEARRMVSFFNSALPNGNPQPIPKHAEELLLRAIGTLRARYQRVVEALAPLVNSIAAYVPQRRSRKLHIGLFGYSRSVRGVALPRAIPFAASFYTLGLPPEFIGAEALRQLKEEEWEALREHYRNMKRDFEAVAGLISWENLSALRELSKLVAKRSGMSVEALSSALKDLSADLRTIEEMLGISLGPKSLGERKHQNLAGNFLLSYLGGEEAAAKASLLEAAKLRRCIG